jgi:roadblock/LC7 domain-containing protein
MDEVSATVIKGVSAAGGFLGGSSLLVYMKPTSLKEALMRVGVTTIAATMTAPAISLKFLDTEAPEVLGGIAFGIGFIAWNVLGAIAVFFQNRQGQDIKELVKSAKDD